MNDPHAKGGNYSIEIDRAVALCRVWKTPDVTREEGAQFAAEKVRLLGELASLPRTRARALIFDLREAPPVWGPATQEALETIVAAWERARKRIAVVVSDDAIQRLQMNRIVAVQARAWGKIVGLTTEAWTWIDSK